MKTMERVCVDRLGGLTASPAFVADPGLWRGRWWRAAAATIILIVLSIAIQLIAVLAEVAVQVAQGRSPRDAFAAAGGLEATPGLTDDIRLLAVVGLSFGLTALSFLFVLRRLYGLPMMSWITSWPRFSGRLFFAGVVVCAIGLTPGILLAPLFEPDPFELPILQSPSLGMQAAYVLALLAFIPLQAGFEEVVFRGFLLRMMAGLTRNLPLILAVNAVLFAALHEIPDTGVALAIGASAVVWCWAALRLGGLEFAIGAHAANNVIVGVIWTAMNSPVEPLTPIDLISEAIAILITLAGIELIARWPRLCAWCAANQP